MGFLKIPSRYQPGIKQLIILENESINRIINELQSLSPCIKINNLATSVHLKIDNIVKKKALEEIFRAIIALYSLREYDDLSVEELVENIIEAVSQTDSLSELYKNNESKFKERLSLFMNLDDIFGVIYKAINVMTEHSNIFLDSRVFTDVRPVFKISSEQDIAGVVMVHNLKLDYRNGGERKEFFVALDESDLKQIQEQLKRANSKSSNLKKLLVNKEINYLDS